MSRPDTELLELCASNNLSLVALQETINTLGPRLSQQNQLCFHQACANKNVTLEIVQLLHSIWPDVIRLRDDEGDDIGWLPIHHLCDNKDLDENTSIDILQFMLNIDHTLAREVDGGGCLPIHRAAIDESTAFCKILIDKYPESLRLGDGWLPIHLASAHGTRDDTVDTIQYMLELDPELTNKESSDGYLPIHYTAMVGNTNAIELLLNYDPDAASKQNNDGSCRLPLHLACCYNTNENLSSVQVLYDAYPEAILAGDTDRRTPLDLTLALARDQPRKQPTIDFLQAELVYARRAQDMTTMTTLDENGQLPLHRALKDNATFGSIKLLVKGNPSALRVMDNSYALPLHIACQFSLVKVAEYLVQCNQVILNHVDANNNSPLHCACRGGNLCVIKFLLEPNVPSVSERNNDNKLAIHLLLECGDNILDRESLEYVETVYQLILANPEVVQDFMSDQLRQM